MRRRATRCALTLAVAASSCGKSADRATPAPADPPRPALWRPTTHPGCYDPGDLLQVRVADLTGPDSTTAMPARVAADGTIRLPFLSGPVAVAGLDRADAAARVATAYRDSSVLSHARVDVVRLQVAGTAAAPPASIGRFDLVRVGVYELRAKGGESASVGRVDDRGTVWAPLLGPVAVAGQTEPAAAAAVAQAYREANMLAHAQVSILVLEPAPADAAHESLPDGPIEAVPAVLKDLYLPQ